jgi:hypothetical protein
MTIPEIQKVLKDNGINLKAAEVEAKLKDYEMTADQVTPEIMTGWVEELKQSKPQSPARQGKGGGLAKSETSAPATQAPAQPPTPAQQPEVPVNVPFANLDQVLGGVENVGVQIVVQTNDHINHVVDKVVGFAQAAPTIAAQRINQRMGLVALENPVESILQANRDLCLNSLSRIDEAIAKAS